MHNFAVGKTKAADFCTHIFFYLSITKPHSQNPFCFHKVVASWYQQYNIKGCMKVYLQSITWNHGTVPFHRQPLQLYQLTTQDAVSIIHCIVRPYYLVHCLAKCGYSAASLVRGLMLQYSVQYSTFNHVTTNIRKIQNLLWDLEVSSVQYTVLHIIYDIKDTRELLVQ